MRTTSRRVLIGMVLCASAAVPAIDAGAESVPEPAPESDTATANAAAESLVTDDVTAWLRATDPTLIVDTTCVDPGGTVPVLFSPNVLLTRTTAPAATRTKINNIVTGLIGPHASGNWVNAEYQTLTFPTPPSGPITPVVRFVLKPRAGSAVHPLVQVARSLNDQGVKASIDYALSPSPYVRFWPAGPPTAAASADPKRTQTLPGGQALGNGVRVDIYDTGKAPTNQGALLAGVTTLKPGDSESLDANGDSIVNYPHAAHGIAMAGIIKTLSPGTTIRIGRISTNQGMATDWTAVQREVLTLKQTQVANWPDVIVHAFGSSACDRQAAQPASSTAALVPVTMEAFIETLSKFAASKPDGLLLVASSGNRASSTPFYPAAFQLDPTLEPIVVSVGAIDANVSGDGNASAWFSTSRTGPVSNYSNTGSWVEAYAPGNRLATAHAVNKRWDAGGPVLQGLAYVEGTSFSGPYVAALIAEQMSRTGQSAGDAWAAIKRCGRAPSPPLDGSTRPIGPGVAVGLKSLTSQATSPPGSAAAC